MVVAERVGGRAAERQRQREAESAAWPIAAATKTCWRSTSSAPNSGNTAASTKPTSSVSPNSAQSGHQPFSCANAWPGASITRHRRSP